VYYADMSNPKVMEAVPRSNELASLMNQLAVQKAQMESLLRKVEDVLRRENISSNTGRVGATASGDASVRKSPLDNLREVIKSTADLREPNGNLSAARVAKVFGVSLTQLAEWLGRTKQALSKTPDADSLQKPLGYFERVARLRMITRSDVDFRKWLRTPHPLLDSGPPMDLLARHEWQSLVDYVEDILTGNPG
jgi:hypothetical protein